MGDSAEPREGLMDDRWPFFNRVKPVADAVGDPKRARESKPVIAASTRVTTNTKGREERGDDILEKAAA